MPRHTALLASNRSIYRAMASLVRTQLSNTHTVKGALKRQRTVCSPGRVPSKTFEHLSPIFYR